MGQPGPSSIVTIAKGDGSRVVEPRRFVARDRQAFQAVWAAHAGQDMPVPSIDFSTRMAVAVFAGARPTPGFEIEITDTRREGSTLVIVDEERAPPADRIAAQVIVSPFHIASLPRHDGEIRFATPDGPQQTSIIFRTVGADHADHADRTVANSRLSDPRNPRDQPDSRLSSGLTPPVAAALAYLAGPLSGALLLATERTNSFVRFHAWQALLGLGILGIAALGFLVLAFAFLIVSPTAFWVMLWLSAATAATWLAAWAVCVVQAYQGRLWKLPLFGHYAERKIR
jgi:uncharacterized membrane protein